VSRNLFPGEYELWEKLAPRFAADLSANELVLWRLSGLEKQYGPLEDFIKGGHHSDMVGEINVFLLNAFVLDVAARRIARTIGRGVGRPPDVMTPDLSPNLLAYFLRHNGPTGRRSIVVLADGKNGQAEAGPLFEFFKTAIEPLNRYLTEIQRKPLSPARLARYALNDRKRKLTGGLAEKTAVAVDRQGSAWSRLELHNVGQK